MGIILKSISLENFKGCKKAKYDFGMITKIFGANATGKTTLFDALTWLLFNKDSLGSEKFSIRPLDKDGNVIHNVEIKVSAVFDVDGREMELAKKQREKWVKKRGSETAELHGNENLYEIDGYPKTEKDYKSAISDLVGEDLFKMLTNPTYFPSLKWKEQRDILMRFVSDVTDYDLAKDKPEFEPLLAELQKAPSTDDIKAKYQKSLTEWKKKQAEIPVRIDEAEKQRVDIDLAELELERNAVQELLNANAEKQKNADLSSEDYNKIHAELMELKFAQSDFIRKANESNVSMRSHLEDKIFACKNDIARVERLVRNDEDRVSHSEAVISLYEKQIAEVRSQWSAVNSSQFDENEQICTVCGQMLPKDKISSNRADFEERKKQNLESITAKGNSLKSQIDAEKSKIVEANYSISEQKKNIEQFKARLSELEQQLSELPTSIDVSADTEYLEIGRKIDEKLSELRKFDSAEDLKRELRAEETELRNRMAEVKAKFAKAEANRQIDDRIAELRSEQREVAQKVADMEKMIYLLESFIRYKMDLISENINGKFDGISWKLFHEQQNKAIVETCECTVDGVPYSSLNNGHRIVAGLKIIKALQELYGVSAPIFVDNSEAISKGNLPKMDCQMILLTVSDDKELRVEKE